MYLISAACVCGAVRLLTHRLECCLEYVVYVYVKSLYGSTSSCPKEQQPLIMCQNSLNYYHSGINYFLRKLLIILLLFPSTINSVVGLSDICVCHFLTSCIAIKQEGVLELEVQVFSDWLGQVLYAESVHDGKTMSGGSQPTI